MEEKAPLNILILEDNDDDAELVLHALRREFEVSWKRVQTAEDYLALLSPDLDAILADYTMPQFSAPEALELLSARDLDVPFIIVSGTVGEDVAVAAMKKGANDYLLKDRLGRLGEAIRRAIHQKSLHKQRRESAEALRESERQLRELFEFTPIPLILTRREDGTVLQLNRAIQEYMGLPLDRALDFATSGAHVSPPDREGIIQALVEQGGVDGREIEVRLPSGEKRWIILSSRLLQSGGEPVVLSGFQDITWRKRAERDQQLLLDLMVRTNRAADIDDVLATALVMLGDVSNWKYGEVWMPDADGERLIFGPATYVSPAADGDLRTFAETSRGYSFRRGEGLPGRVWATREAEWVRDVSVLPETDYLRVQLAAEFNLNAALGVPIYMDDGLLAVMVFYMGRPQDKDEHTVRLITTAAEHLSTVLMRRQAEDAERAQRTFAEALADIATTVNSTLNLNEVLDHVLLNANRVVPHDASEIWLIEDGWARVGRSRGYAGRGSEDALAALRLPVAETHNMREAIATGRPIIVDDVRRQASWVSSEVAAWVRSLVTVPIRVSGGIVGFLNLVSQTPEFFSVKHGERLQTFASQAAVAIENAQLYAELEHYSESLEAAVRERTAELLKTKEEIEAIVDSVGEAILVGTPEGVILNVNPAFETQTGFSVQEALGENIYTLLLKNHVPQEQFEKSLGLSMQGQPGRAEFTVERCDGSTYDAAMTITPMRDPDGQISAIVAAMRDISRIKEVQRMKDDFVSTAAHELRTPLTSIRGFSEILLTRDLEQGRQKQYLTHINRQATQLAEIIDDLLDISRLEARRALAIRPEAVDIQDVVHTAVDPFIETAADHRILLICADAVPNVRGDPFRLVQVVRNLVSNAVKYSPGGGTVEIRCRLNGEKLEVSVKDDGHGMTREQQEHLFEKFWRAETSQTAGTGLGLTICKLIVEGHGGEIWAESEYGKGSIFTFTVPLA